MDVQDQWNKDKKLTKQQCQAIYPDGNDGLLFFGLQMKFLSRAKAEKFLYACNYDFAIANELSALCHFNFFFLMNIIERFDGDYKEACLYLRKFKNHQPRNAETTHCKAALETLSAFKNEGNEASKYLSLFKDNVITASSFLSRFQNDTTKAKNFIKRFMNDWKKSRRVFEKVQGRL